VSELPNLIEEAQRQLTICNSCRYCEGYCSVWPAVERRHEFDLADLTQLSNLCHDCRDCLDACMYAAPHEFNLNPPQVFSELRSVTYQAERPKRSAAARRVWTVLWLITAAIVLTVIAGVDRGFHALWQDPHGAASPYSLMSYGVLVVAMAIPALWGVAELGRGAYRYWRQTATPLRAGASTGTVAAAAVGALKDAATLRNLGGGGIGCTYPEEVPAAGRKWFHHLVAYGFLACLCSTVAAGIEQDFAGVDPPYPFISAPVLLGTIGGAAMLLGCAGLLVLKARARPAAIDPGMAERDYSFITALGALALTGLLVEVLRTTPVFSILLVIHLAVIAMCFAVAPYSKFVHAIYRYLALVQDRLEIAHEDSATAGGAQ
jgi:citrate/tricarballylate utilization protein